MRGAEFNGTSRFEVVRKIGEGGMGVVYEVVDRLRDVHLALKTLRHLTPDALGRLKREFRALQDLSHPNLVMLHELIEDEGTWFFTMELLEGVDFLTYARPSANGVPGAVPFELAPTLAGPELQEASAEVATRRERGGFDEARLRACLGQLARGLAYLHGSGRVHRDIKPPNLLVEPDGRLVVLDFGLVADTADLGGGAAAAEVVGTVAYMAPEQFGTQPVGPPADWYSVGVVLYLALTNVLPFAGQLEQVAQDKQRRRPIPPSERVDGVPEELESLCMALLEIDAADRPNAASTLAQLGLSVEESRSVMAASWPATRARRFVGRLHELRLLRDALDEVIARGEAVTVVITGESGVGKSALAAHFLQSLSLPELVVVLAGRCYERESVPYKAIDGVVDALADYLRELPTQVAAALLPPRAALLAQTFPVLRGVRALAEAPRHEVEDRRELRAHTFRALRELFLLLAEHRRVVVVIDDLQWADADSVALLEELLRPPSAAPLLLIAMWRPVAQHPFGGEPPRLPGHVRSVTVAGLGPQEARELAKQLFDELAEGDDRALVQRTDAWVAAETAGHPLHIRELAHYLVRTSGHQPNTDAAAVPHLEDAIWERIASLEPAARELLEVAATARAPLPHAAAASALGLDVTRLERLASQLEASHLVRASGARATRTIEPYHERIRQAVLPRLAAEILRARHAQIARALESVGGESEALAIHFAEAGESARAAHHAERAADEAADALAFERAARLYRLALSLRASDPQSLLRRLGDVLAHAGRSEEAARTFLEAASGALADEATELQRRAAQHLLCSGHVEEGLENFGEILTRHGLHYPKTPRRAIAAVLARRARLRWRGLKFRAREESAVAQDDLNRIDVCWHSAVGLGMIDPIRGNAFHATGLLLALRAGEPYRLARSLAMEGAYLAVYGSRTEDRVNRLLAVAEDLAFQAGHPHAVAFVTGCRGHAAALLGRFDRALDLCREAESQFRERCTGVPWEIATLRVWIGRSLALTGRLKELSDWAPRALQECRERGDLYGDTTLSVSAMPFKYLTDDDAEAAQAEVDRALTQWSSRGFSVQHYYALYSRASAHLYQADGAAAWRCLQADARALRRSMLLRTQLIRITIADLTARASLQSVGEAPRPKRYLRTARAAARRLEGEGTAFARSLALVIRATATAWSVGREASVPTLRAAIARFEDNHMTLHAAAARRRLGEVIGGDEGRALASADDDWLRAEGARHPGRVTDMLVPRFPD